MKILASVSAAALIFFVISLFDRPGKTSVKKRLDSLAVKKDIDSIRDEVIREKHKKNMEQNGFTLVSRKFAEHLAASGLKLSAKEYLAGWAGTTLIPIILTYILNGNTVTVIGAGVIGFAVPPLLVKRARKKRQEEFSRELGEALVIMGNCLKAGYTFQQAMESIASDMLPPIAPEFAKTLREIQYGVSQEDALKHMSERIQNKDFDLLVSAVVTAAQVGSNLTEILDIISATIKDRIQIKSEVRIMTATGRISGIVIGLLPVFICLILMLINPEYIMSFFESGMGKIMIGAGCFLELTGFAIVSRLVDIKY